MTTPLRRALVPLCAGLSLGVVIGWILGAGGGRAASRPPGTAPGEAAIRTGTRDSPAQRSHPGKRPVAGKPGRGLPEAERPARRPPAQRSAVGSAGTGEALAAETAADPRAASEAPTEPAWSVLSWRDEEGLSEQVGLAQVAADRAEGCEGVEVQRIACAEPPCLVFFSAPEALCLPFEEWNDVLPACPWPDPAQLKGPAVFAAPIRCPDGYTECVRAFMSGPETDAEFRALSAGEAYDLRDGAFFGSGLETFFHVGRRLTEGAPAWVCEGARP